MSKETFYRKIKDSNKVNTFDLFDELENVPTKGISSKSGRVHGFYIPIDKIKFPEINIRENNKKDKDFELLVSSIKNNKVIEPLVVYYDEKDSYYHLIIGSRRLLASIDAGLKEVPCIIKKEKPSDKDILIEVLIENLHRKNLTPFEEADSYYKLINDYGYSQTQIVSLLGKPKSRVSEIMKVYSIPDSVKEKVTTSELFSREHLLEIARQKNEEDMLFLAEKINEERLNIQQTRHLSKKLRDKSESLEKRTNIIINKITKLSKELCLILESEVDENQLNKVTNKVNEIKCKIDDFITKYKNQIEGEKLCQH